MVDIRWTQFLDEEGKPLGEREELCLARCCGAGDVFIRGGKCFKIVANRLDLESKTQFVTIAWDR